MNPSLIISYYFFLSLPTDVLTSVLDVQNYLPGGYDKNHPFLLRFLAGT
jgi:hypothetical protein